MRVEADVASVAYFGGVDGHNGDVDTVEIDGLHDDNGNDNDTGSLGWSCVPFNCLE